MRTKFGIVFLVVFLSGCTNLGAVRDWAATSMEAAQFNGIVATYADTPHRLAYYDRDGADQWSAQAAVRAEQARALDLQLALVADYMAALGALAADGAADYKEDVGKLKDALAKTDKISSKTLGAVGKVATTLFNAAAQQWQKARIRELVEKVNPSLQGILKGELRSIVHRDFRRDLRVEAGILDRYFKDLLTRGGGSDAANAALNEWYLLRKAENARRVIALDAYVGILDNIAAGHQTLFDNRNDLEAVRLVKDLVSRAKKIRARITKIVTG